MVKFLVQNSLGATWMMMHPESKLSARWEYYVNDADRMPREERPVAENHLPLILPAAPGISSLKPSTCCYAMYEEEDRLCRFRAFA